MPLLVNGKVQVAPDTVKGWLDESLVEKSSKMTKKPSVVVGPAGLLYVSQREYAVVKPDDPNIKIIGSEDATTCHLLVLRHTGSGVTGLGHCDGCDTKQGIKNIIEEVKTLSAAGPEGCFEVHLFGGFLDDRKESLKVSKDIIIELIESTEELHLRTAAITDFNNTIKNGVNFPIIYGIAVKVSTGEINPATFTDKGPDMDIRGASHFGGFNKMVSIYSELFLKIGPYEWEAFENVDRWAEAPDSLIRRYLSTSPQQEPEHFEDHVRGALRILTIHPTAVALFPDGKPRLYKKEEDGSWKKI